MTLPSSHCVGNHFSAYTLLHFYKSKNWIIFVVGVHFSGLVNLQEEKKDSEFYFFKLAKNEIYYYYCYYFQEVHFWPCELARPKNALLELLLFFFGFVLFAYSILIF
jgi:hypothetical protein